MVLCHLQLISLKPGVTPAAFLGKLRRAGVRPVVRGRVVRWMVLPTHLSTGHLLSRNLQWDLLLVLEDKEQRHGDDDDRGEPREPASLLPHDVRRDVAAAWSASCGVPAHALAGYSAANAALLRPPLGARVVPPPELPEVDSPVPARQFPSSFSSHSSHFSHSSSPYPGDSARWSAAAQRDLDFEASLEMGEWIASLPSPLREQPVTMVSLVALRAGERHRRRQHRDDSSRSRGDDERGAAPRHGRGASAAAPLANDAGARHGARVKLSGDVVAAGGGSGAVAARVGDAGWDEFALVHFPSVQHYAAMAATADYQEASRRYRLRTLEDALVLCVLEVDDDGVVINLQSTSRERL
ncbi:hypothetical protein GGS23DRAFT_608665 [Durotheca rogersii]|uniref:uncharacterized protein n=1 Tax=Durotheca rogersii TaxID=419775 RepID=UPI002220B70D|nr:uncharacterized protein GGS23DRAFT_608665 [Durotheca rogersii]KAI5868102.1 hypothetical protein GGS23DRAFT_608665 [Durotheca rogersii]